ncbi:MAG: Glu/Leu/Phe/Val family dehydrogenase [Gemmatimonadota bacterium]
MEIFSRLEEHEHEQLAFWSEPAVGYRGIIAIHDTTLGPALGGTRFWSYESDEEAVVDVLRLSRAMTYKAAVMGLNVGGGKSVLIGDPRTPDREMIFRAHGRAIESLGGRYITAEDVGTTARDMEFVRMETEWVTGTPESSGDPSPLTAWGVFQGIRACLDELHGTDQLEGRHVSIQGAGHVGYYLARYLTEVGAKITVADIDEARAARIEEEFGADRVEPEEIYDVEADAFAPCALGGVLNDETLPRLRVDIVAGSANNQLAEERHAAALAEQDILYAPDYVINAGGLCSVYGELQGWTDEQARRTAGRIYETLRSIFRQSRDEKIPTTAAADRLAEARISRVRHLHRSRLRPG